MSTATEALADHFSRTWEMLRETIMAFPSDRWRGVDRNGDRYLTPAGQALHTIETAEFYMAGSHEEYMFGARFGIDWEDAAPETLPSQQDQLAFLDEVARELDERLGTTTDKDLAAAPAGFPWTGPNMLAHWLYVLRHNQHHIAVMNTLLRTRVQIAVGWK